MCSNLLYIKHLERGIVRELSCNVSIFITYYHVIDITITKIYNYYIEEYCPDFISKTGGERKGECELMNAMLYGILDNYKSSTPTIPQMFYNTVQNAGSQPANTYKFGSEWKTISYQEWAQISEEIAAALIQHGVKKGDDIAILSKPCAQVGWADMAILLTGAVVATITPLVHDDELKYIINESDIKYVFVESSMMVQRMMALWNLLPSLKGIICLEESYSSNFENVFGLEEFREIGRSCHLRSSDLALHWQRLTLQDPARLDYTKSTAGKLKCTQIKHGEWLQAERIQYRRILSANMQGKYNNVIGHVLTIPNVNTRTSELFSMIAIGALIKYGSGPSKLQKLQDLKALRQSAAV
jgi:hypothetical protein